MYALYPNAEEWTDLPGLTRLPGSKASIVGGKIRLTGGAEGGIARTKVIPSTNMINSSTNIVQNNKVGCRLENWSVYFWGKIFFGGDSWRPTGG